MADKAWKALGYKGMGDASAAVPSAAVDSGHLAVALGIDQEGAAELANGLGVEEGFLMDAVALPKRKVTEGGKKLLVIASSPMETNSVSNAVGNAFVEKYKSSFPADEVEMMNISAGQLLPFTASRVVAKFKNQAGGDVEAQREWVETKIMIDRFKAADKVVFLLPMWNFHVPSDVKLYLDHIVQAHKTFDPSTYAGLVTGKPALLIRASSGVAIGSDMDTGTAYMKQILAFIGFTDIRVLAATGFPGADGSRPWLDVVKKQAEELAVTFMFDPAASLVLPKEMLLGAPAVPDPSPLPTGAKILHVSSSPMGQNSASLAAAEAFLDAAKRQVGAVVDHLDLARLVENGALQHYSASRVKAKFATFGSADASVPEDVAKDWQYTKDLIEQCKVADVIVFSVPMWNLSIPYTLKRWMDHVAQPHKTFDPATYKGLLGKRGFVISASGSGLLGGAMDHLTPYMKQFCGFTGIEPVFHAYVNGSVGDKKAAAIDAAVKALKVQACL
jgi:FMN-dependent NADH-azoreductase